MNKSNKKQFYLSLSTLVLVLLGGVLLLANVQNQQETRSRAGVNSVQVQCGQQFPPVVEIAFAFTNTESYPVDLVASFSDSDTDPIVEITNIPPGESRNGILNTERGVMPAGNLMIDWFPSDQNSTANGGSEQRPFTALTCDPNATVVPSTTVTATSAPTVTQSASLSGTVTPTVNTTATPTTNTTITPTSAVTGTPVPTVLPTRRPLSAAETAADLNDDGVVNQFDYNLFIREITTQLGR